MKKILLNLLLLIIISPLSAQVMDRGKAEKQVQEYLKTKYNNYYPHSFSEFFEQHDVEDLQREINATEVIAFSLVHSYKLGDKIVKDEYFHFDKNYNVLGQISYDRMLELSVAEVKTVFNSTFLSKFKTVNTQGPPPDSVGRDMAEGLAYMMMEKYKDAIEAFTSAIKKAPNRGDFYFYRGQCHEKRKKRDLACEDFKSSKKLGYVNIELDEN